MTTFDSGFFGKVGFELMGISLPSCCFGWGFLESLGPSDPSSG